MKKSTLVFIVKLAITGILLVILVRVVGGSSLLSSLAGVSPWAVTVSALLWLVGTWLNTIRWNMLLKTQSVRISFKKLFEYNLSYGFYSIVLPGGKLAAEAVRTYQIARDAGAEVRPHVILSAIMDRVFAVVSFSAIAAVFLLSGWGGFSNLPSWFLYVTLLGVVGVILLVALPFEWFLKPFMRFLPVSAASTLSKISASWKEYRKHPGLLVAAFSVALLADMSFAIGAYVIAQSLGLSVAFTTVLAAFSLGMVAAFLPLTIAGIGVRDGVFTYVLSVAAGITPAAALSVSLVALASSMLVNLLGGLVELRRHFFRK